jgi:hypothetical protein
VDGENDFVVLDQQRGTLLVLEIKEDVIRFDVVGDRSVCFQGSRQMDVNPWTQAAGNKYSLVKWLSAKFNWDEHSFPLSHGHAVLLPDVHTPVGSPLPDITRDTALTWGSDEDLAAKMEACSEAWLKKGLREPSDLDIEAVRKSFMPSFVYGDKLGDRIGVERREEREDPARNEQLLEFIGNRRQARIAGCAGAGKTTLAVAKAKQLAAQELTVLVLVYNKGIAGYLTEHFKATPTIHVRTLEDFCRERCAAAGFEFPASASGPQLFDGATWWGQVAELLDRALVTVPAGYGALIVDEAQDIQCSVWLALEKAITPGGWYYLFYDKKQNVFAGDLQWPVKEEPFLLLRNCRGTKAILGALNSYTGIELTPREGLPDGQPVREESGSSPGQRSKALGKILHDWIRREGLTENQVVVLGAHSLEHTCMEKTGQAACFKIIERGVPGPGVIPYYTYMAFKGCEADAVILLDVDFDDARWDKQGLYTAMTRARHLLGVVRRG